ncbi:hypothetical protein HJB82_10375 [Rhizobium sp. NZLR10]|uniref:hypothetical protein n=1 Tax=Rhizobium sp. NZLR10 TaxID=2731097 RepID=UPI001C828BB3|nr:hypothetical protein [Rhizobium sp. NZLR10]MBX5195729.1 hypothetical protein [Rhizobium sp. NZLR10]
MILLIIGMVFVVAFFFFFPKPTLFALAAVLVAGIGVAIFLYFQQASHDGSITSIKGTSRGTEGCAESTSPVFVRLFNGSGQQVDVIRFRLVAKRPGFSVEYYSDYLTSYKIIEPGGTYDNCWSLNQYRGLQTLPEKLTPSQLDWSVEISSVEFADGR